MNSKLKSILLALAPAAFALYSCQEPSGVSGDDNSGKAAAVITVGNGSRLTLTTNQHWTSGNTYILDGEVVISGASLTIDAGVVVKGKKDPTPNDTDPLNSCLVIARDGQIFASGTSSSPIVFTSDQAVNQRNPGDWGGIIIAGPAVVNQANPSVEGFSESIPYGGTGDTRTAKSGSLEFARIEFAGTILEDGNETNGLTLAGVAKGTNINHIQVSRGNDDGFEMFGGDVDLKFVVSWQNRDDDFDTDLGFTGVVQYAIARRLNAFVSTEANGLETDNNGTGSTATPETRGLFANVTLIGPGDVSGDGSGIDLTAPNVFNAGALIRRNSSTSLYNSIITAWPTGINVRDNLTAQNALGATPTAALRGITYGQLYTGGTYLLMDPGITGVIATNYVNLYNNAASLNDETAALNPGPPNAASSVGLKNAAFNATSPDFTPATVLGSVAAVPTGVTVETFRGATDADGVFNGGTWNFGTAWLNFSPATTVYP